MLDDAGMVDRDVRRPLLEVPDRVASRLHDLADELIRQPRRARQVVDELGLGRAPVLGEPSLLSGRQGANPKLLDALFPFRELALGAALIRMVRSSAFSGCTPL